jgi:hypothetical protein
VLLFLGIISFSCSAKPSEADATKALEAHCSDLCKVNSLRVIGGQTVPSDDRYDLHYQADLECLRVNVGGYQSIDPPAKCERIGDIKKVKGVVHFRKTEKGWRGWIALGGGPQEIKE